MHKHAQKTQKRHIISCVALMYIRQWGVSPLEAPARKSVDRRIMGINQGKATALCLFNRGDGYSLNVSPSLKQLASFQKVDSVIAVDV